MKLVCIGNVTIDDVVLPDGSQTATLGGDAVYAALAARLIGAEVAMIAPRGCDNLDSYDSLLARAGITWLPSAPRELPAVRNRVEYFADGSRQWHLLCEQSAFDALSVRPSDVPYEALDADAILVSAMTRDAQSELQPWLREASSATLLLDVAEDYVVPEPEAPELRSMIAACDIFMPSRIEAEALTATTDLSSAADSLHAWGPDTVVIKDSEHGCVVSTRGTHGTTAQRVPAEATSLIDATGAGDSFCGAFAAAHMLGASPVEAARQAAHIAAIAVSGFGISALARHFTAVSS